MTEGQRRWTGGEQRWTVVVALAVAYIPLLASSPGLVGADTKAYLYLDPGRLLDGASSLWDADRALGTVTHQNIGFLWPMGPFYWLFDTLGVPDWVAQRLWLGTLLAAAGLGMRYLLRTLNFDGRGLIVAMLAYQLSPYLLNYSARISAVLLPWAGLGWMIGLTVRAARTGGWRHPALFALTVLTVGSVNATSLLLAGLGPVLWLAHATVTDSSITVRQALGTATRIGVLTVGTSLWWVAGLVVQGGYGLAVTRFTETYEVIAAASTAPEVMRGLGYWFFYGNDKFGPWIQPSVYYTQGGWLIFLSFGLVVLAVGTACVLRWRHRSFFVLLAAVGTLVAVGAHPFEGPSLLGGLFERFTHTDPGLAMRSLPRAVPLVVLATAALLGAGVDALWSRTPRIGAVFGVLVLAAVVLANPAMWKLRMIEGNLNRPEEVPDYWLEAAAALDAEGVTGVGESEPSRVLEIPGSDFASYRWGNTVDPITPGLMQRGYAARELVPFGSAYSAALISAFDRRLQEGTLDSDSVATVARLMSVGDVVHRADLSYERFRTPRPVQTAALLARADGLLQTETFGESVPNVAGPQQTLIDEIRLARPTDAAHPAPVTRYEVSAPLPLLRTRPVGGATVLIGDADGIVDAAGARVLDVERPVVFAADLMSDPRMAESVLAEPTQIIVTDTNRRRAQRWGTIRENRGHTEQAGEVGLTFDPTDNRLPVFDRLKHADSDPDDSRTVAEQRGPLTVQATAYGNPVTYTNDDRPYHAVDGSLSTAWAVAAFDEARGEELHIRLTEPARLDSVRLVQPLGRDERHVVESNRRITEVEIRADGRRVTTATLDERSLRPAGQTLPLNVEAAEIEIEITDTDVSRRALYPGIAPVGFAEVDLALGPVTEVVRTPRALLDRLGGDLDDHALTVVLTRERSNPQEPVRVDPELYLSRSVPLPVARDVTVVGTARLSAAAASEKIDTLLRPVSTRTNQPTSTETNQPAPTETNQPAPTRTNQPMPAITNQPAPTRTNQPMPAITNQPTRGGAVSVTGSDHLAEGVPSDAVNVLSATSSGYLAGDLRSLPAAVLDGDTSTSWTGRFGPQAGQWIEIQTDGQPFEAAEVEIDVVVDRLHSTPTVFRVLTDGIDQGVFNLGLVPASADTETDSVSTVTLPQPVSGSRVRLEMEAVEERLTRDWYSNGLVALPVSVAEVRISRYPPLDPPAPIATGCRADLLWVNDEAVPVRVTGTADDALERRELRLEGCAPVTLQAGDNVIVTAPGSETGLNIDQLVMVDHKPVPRPVNGIGVVAAVRHDDTAYTARVPAAAENRWLVLGQSHNLGWRAVTDGVDLGHPVVIDGFANGWLLPAHDEPVTVELRWAPQRLVDWALRLSALFVALSVLLAVRGRARPNRMPSSSRIAEPVRPVLRWPWEMPATRRRQSGLLIAAATAMAVVATANLPTVQPWWLLAGPMIGAVVVVACRSRPLNGFLAFLAAASLGVAALYVLIQQYRFRYPPDFVWPQQFEAVHVFGVIAALCLLADYTVTALTARPTRAA